MPQEAPSTPAPAQAATPQEASSTPAPAQAASATLIHQYDEAYQPFQQQMPFQPYQMPFQPYQMPFQPNQMPFQPFQNRSNFYH